MLTPLALAVTLTFPGWVLPLAEPAEPVEALERWEAPDPEPESPPPPDAASPSAGTPSAAAAPSTVTR